jgi:hypothetical protein
MNTRATVPTVATVLALCLGGLAQAQEVVRVPDAPVCASCTIAVERIAVLGDANSEVPFNVPVAAAVDARGRIYLSMRSSLGQVHVFSSNGDHLATIGRDGEGPGEYRVIEHIFIRGDSLFIVDARLLRLTVLDEDWQTVSTTRIPTRPLRATLSHERGLLINAVPANRVPTPPVQRLAPDGAVTASYGDPVIRQLGDPLSATRTITQSGRDTTVWVAYRDRYQLERYSWVGSLLSTIRRVAPWFEEYRPSSDPPRTVVSDVVLDSLGYLWVLTTVLEDDWRESLERAREDRDPVGVNDRVWDSIVEVIDPRGGAVVARRRLDQHMQRFPAPGVLFSYAETDVGVPQISLWRLRLITGRE